MKIITLAFAGLLLFSTWAHAGETLDAAAVKKLITGNTVHGLGTSGGTPKIYFAPDGKAYRTAKDKILEGTWEVKDDGTQCVGNGLPGGCAKIVRNEDGSYDRISPDGVALLRWTAVVNGKDF